MTADGSAMPVTLRVLGFLSAAVGGRALALAGPRQQAVLARLLVAGDAPVTAEQVVEDVWGEDASPSTVTSVHAYVSRLRKALGETAVPRRRVGYFVDRSVVAVDADAFADEVETGRRALARGADAEAAAALERALARWTGPRAFAGLPDAGFLVVEAARLDEMRVAAAETLADAHARLGRSADDIERLEELAIRDPLREPLAVRLVTALHNAGRQSDALAAFDRCRRALAEQLGVSPAARLRRVHEAVLAQETLITVAEPARRTNLPPRSLGFVGREALLADVDAVLDAQGSRPQAVALCGLAGAGKTELARELAHRRRREGRAAWWIPSEDPAGTAAGLADLAAALGIADHQREEDVRAALWRELDRSPGWVLVFDNVDEPARIEPYLPRAVHGDVVITSRNPAWRRLARPVTVPPMERRESVAYVVARSGDPDAGAAAALADLLGDLPLALQQACAYIEQTGMPVPDYVRLFRRNRTHVLLSEEEVSGPTVATTWGLAFDRVRRRSGLAVLLLETIAFLAADAVGIDMLAPLAEDELDLQDAIAELLRLSLVERAGSALRVHRLVQDVVRARMGPPTARDRLASAVALCGAIERRSGDAALHLVPLAAHAHALGVAPSGLVESLSTAGRRYSARALYPAAEQLLTAGLRLVGPDGDPGQRGRLLCQLGEVLDAAGRLTEALDLHRRAVALLDGTADTLAVAHAHNRLGHVLNCADDAGGAIAAHEQALAILRRARRNDRAAPVLVDLGYTLWGAGVLDRADAALNAGRDLLTRGTRDWAHATAGLGMVAQDRGDLAGAVALQHTAIDEFTEVCGADHPDTAQALDKLGYALRLQGRASEAIDAHQRAVRLLERVLGPDDSRVAMTLTNLGLAQADAGRVEAAVTSQTRAHRLFLAALGATHSSTLLAGRRRAVALAVAGRPAQAITVLEKVLDVLSDRPGSGREAVAADAAFVYAAAGDEDAARFWQLRAEDSGVPTR